MKMSRKNNPFKKNKNEIIYNLINAGLAAILVLAGSFSNGNISIEGVCFAILAAVIVLITKFKDYWDGEKGEYCSKVFNFIC